MDSSSPSQLPENSETKLLFRKPSNDTALRKYRRRSPVDSASSSSDGSPPHDRNHGASAPKRESKNMTDDRHKRTESQKDRDRDSARGRSGKSSDSHRHSYKQSYSASHDYHRRNDDYTRHYTHSEEEERSYHRVTSRSARESRNLARSDGSRRESDYERSKNNSRREIDQDGSKDNRHNGDKYSRDSPDLGHRSRNKDREITGLERDKNRERGNQDDRRENRRSLGDHKISDTLSNEVSRGHIKEFTSGGASEWYHARETDRSSKKELDGRKENKRKPEERESNRHKERHSNLQENIMNYSRGQEGKNESSLDENREHDNKDSSGKKMKAYSGAEDGQSPAKSGKFPAEVMASSSSKLVQESVSAVPAAPMHSSSSVLDTHDLNAAKVAAMKAAELVNKNLIGGGFLSTDQKKKLLWGNKKSTAADEPGKRWDMPLFSDRDRQEKFNKLMGVKGDLNQERKPDDKDSNLEAEKQNQLQLDLERQYTAGLRRRDGRTVGLGL